ncbi:hypothetical protein PC120_g18706 [Phytophthora cactorum]|nr:hypothetical protein PC120_g18706 [Phytophthora cactorum]
MSDSVARVVVTVRVAVALAACVDVSITLVHVEDVNTDARVGVLDRVDVDMVLAHPAVVVGARVLQLPFEFVFQSCDELVSGATVSVVVTIRANVTGTTVVVATQYVDDGGSIDYVVWNNSGIVAASTLVTSSTIATTQRHPRFLSSMLSSLASLVQLGALQYAPRTNTMHHSMSPTPAATAYS